MMGTGETGVGGGAGAAGEAGGGGGDAGGAHPPEFGTTDFSGMLVQLPMVTR